MNLFENIVYSSDSKAEALVIAPVFIIQKSL